MDSGDVIAIITSVPVDPRLVFVLIIIVYLIKQMSDAIHGRVAEIIAIAVSQILAWGHWLSEFVPIVSVISINILSGIIIWILGKGAYKIVTTTLDRYWKDGFGSHGKEQNDTN